MEFGRIKKMDEFEENIAEIDEKLSPNFKLANSTFNVFTDHFSMNSWTTDQVDKMEVLDIKEYKKIVKQCRFFYRKDPIGSTILNKMVELGITKLVFDKGTLSENEFRIFTSLNDKLQEYAENCSLEYLVTGLVIPEIKYGNVTKEDLFDLGIKKYTTLTLPVSMWLRDPSTIKINTSMVMNEPSYYVILPEELVSFISNKGNYPDGTKDLDLFAKLQKYYPDFVAQVLAGNKEILLENKLIVRRKVLSDSPYPLPYLYPSLEAMKHKRNLRRMDYSIASRAISAIQLIQLGNDDYPVTEDDQDAFAAIRDQMTWRNTGNIDLERIFQLFANHTLKITWVYPPMEVLQDEKKYAEINEDIFFGLGFPRILTTGEAQRTGTSDPEFATMSPVKTMENMQSKILSIIKGIIREISRQNKLKDVPEVRFEKINLHAWDKFVAGMIQLYNTGNISRETFSNAFGFNWTEETEMREDEQKILKEKELGEFAPQPFSPQPTNTGNNTNTQPKTNKNPSAPDNSNKN
jgi:hypothetical protein